MPPLVPRGLDLTGQSVTLDKLGKLAANHLSFSSSAIVVTGVSQMGTWGLFLLTVGTVVAFLPDAETSKTEKVPLHEHPTLVGMLEENNRLRASVGLPPHQISPELTKAAQDHAWFMAKTGSFSHHSNGGPGGRAARHGFGGLASENIAMGHPTIRSVFQGWRASSGHWANLTSNTRLAGFGYGISPSGERYWVAMYGN